MNMKKLKGRLLYMGWFNMPWKLVTNTGQIDLWPIIGKFLASINGKRAGQNQTHDSYTLSIDKSSKYKFKYVPNEFVILEKNKGLGFSNVYAYLDTTLCWLSGRLVEIEIDDGKQMKVSADTSESVFGVYFVGDGNSCEVPCGIEKTVCKAGQHNCCIFLTIGADGFRCEKFNTPMARVLLDRLAKDTMRASRIGNCDVVGRK